MNKKKFILTTILGWIRSFVRYKNSGKSTFAKYYLKQTFGIGIIGALPDLTPIIIALNTPAVSIPLILVTEDENDY